MTVGELKAALDDYGDHLPVVLVVERGQHEYATVEVEVYSTTDRGEAAVEVRGFVT